MVLFQPQLWQLLLLMCLGGLLQTDVCGGQHSVHIQDGPLYRVIGFPMSISCNVSGLKNQREQIFAFSVYQPNNPDSEIRIISTNDPNYSYSMYYKRVKAKNIVIERLSWASVVFHVMSLEKEDNGKYECYTPNTNAAYFGTYSAQTTVNVIEDTLIASYSGPAYHSIFEGESLQLECQVSSQTFQHTHLSVTWYLRSSTDTIPIISLYRDLTVRPGPQFEDRYRSGLIGLEKIEDTTYRLKISQVQQSDSGEIYCQANEWIQDPDRSWFRICYRNTTGTNIEVKALDTGSEVESFVTQIRVLNGALEEGDVLEIHCSIEAQNLPGHFFSMTWLRNSMEVAQIGPSGVLSIPNTYVKREKEGELRIVKKGDRNFVLTIQPVSAEDQGRYQCRAVQEEKTDPGSFNRGKSQLSHEETVHIKAKVSGLTVVMTKQLVNVTEGETLQISCSVSGAKGPLSMSWQHKKSSGSSFNDVISLSREGVMGAVGAQYQHRGFHTFRSNVADFILESSGALVSDSGEYMCTVSEWSMESNGNLKKVNSQSQQGQVSVRSIDSLVTVSLKSRKINVLENSNELKMLCSVKAPKVALAVTWKFNPHNSTAQKNIICMDHTGSISCGGEQQDYQLETQVRESGKEFILRVLRVSKRQEGRYQCQIDAYDKNVQKTRKLSNPLAVTVQRPVSKLSVSITKSPLKTQANSDGVIDCLVTSATSNSSRFEVTWTHGTQILLKMELEGVVTQETDERITMRRTKRQTFQLIIKEVKSTDSGQYSCSIQEWIQDPNGIWYSVDTKSVTVELNVFASERDFSMDKSNVQLKATEGEELKLHCSLGAGGLDSESRYSLSWFFQRRDQSLSTIKLLTYSHDGRLQFQESDPELQNRLSFSRPTISVFYLSILNIIPSDSGSYYCQIEQYQADCKSKWERKASDKSGFTNVTVQLIESKLQVHKANLSLKISNIQTGFMVECKISSRSSDKSVFEVTWSKKQRDEPWPQTIFSANRDGTLHSMIPDRTLLYDRPSKTHYTLTMLNVDPSDNGQYQCQVVEWLQTAANTWRKVAEDKSGVLSINVEVDIKPSVGNFTLETSVTHQNCTEGEQLDISYSMHFDKVDPTFHYTLTWFVERKESKTFLLSHTYNGHLHYQSGNQQLTNRLQFFRPTAKSFRLTILNLDPSDSGRYQCTVEQYQLGCEGTWEKRGTPKQVSTIVHVHEIESKLQVQKANPSLNTSNIQTSFKVECKISSRSSDKSVFEVTWSKKQRDEPWPQTIFSAKRDGTLHSMIPDRTLLYDRPSKTHYTLTMLNVDPSDNGQYQCQVVEWLQTAANTWRKVAEDKSEVLSISVNVPAEAHLHDNTCTSGLILGSLIPLLCLLLGVIIFLLTKVRKTSSTLKKQKASLWVESTPLKAVTETATGNE